MNVQLLSFSKIIAATECVYCFNYVYTEQYKCYKVVYCCSLCIIIAGNLKLQFVAYIGP